MSLSKKLNVKEGMKIRVVAKPPGIDLGDLEETSARDAGALLVFASTLAEVDARCPPVIAASLEDRIAWIAYPKARQLGTDLNRDILWSHLLPRKIRPVRQISIDSVWSALRFRPDRGE